MIDLLGIADALAARYAVMQAPDGLSPITLATARLENNLVNFPAVAVWPPDPGEMVMTYQGTRRKSEIPFTARLYLEASSSDLAKVATTLYRWLPVMVDATHAASKLGLGPVVDKALPVNAGLGMLPYAGKQYAGIEVRVIVWATDSVDLVPA